MQANTKPMMLATSAIIPMMLFGFAGAGAGDDNVAGAAGGVL